MSDTISPTVRKAVTGDAPAIAQFNINMAYETEGLNLIPEVINNGVTAIMSHPERGFYLVVETQDPDGNPQIVASLMVTTEWSDWRNGNFWWIQSVYVVEAWRRRGLYSLMYQEVQNLATDEPNVCGFRLYVEHENLIAQQTYQKLGMSTTHYYMYEQLAPGIKFTAKA